jgi:hypothetical protein
VRHVQQLYMRTLDMVSIPVIERWNKSASISEELIKMTSEAEQLAEHATFVSVT